MKRYTVLRHLVNSVSEGDIVIVVGKELSEEVFKYHRDGTFYTDISCAAAFALGLANVLPNKVIYICEDEYVLNNLSEFAQIAVSKCKNIVGIILNSGYYQNDGMVPSIFDSLSAPKNMMFNMGFAVHDYSTHFKFNNTSEVKNLIKRAVGPLVAFVKVDLGVRKNIESKGLVLNDFSGLRKFIELGLPSSMFEPPITPTDDIVMGVA